MVDLIVALKENKDLKAENKRLREKLKRIASTEETRINNVLCWRDTPDGEWNEYSKESLTTALEATRGQVKHKNARIEKLEAQLAGVCKALEETPK
jgi:cell division septum initiation protein DivIVA